MLGWLSSIGNAIGVMMQFISTFFSGIASVFILIGQSMSFLAVSWAVLPSVLLVFVTAGLTICIVFQLIGR